MNVYETGKKVTEFATGKDRIVFDGNDSGFQLLICFNKLNPKELEQFKSDFTINLTAFKDVLFLTFKFGQLSVMDAPYHPRLSPNLNPLPTPSASEGYALYIMVVDSSNGEIKHQRLIGLSHDFSSRLKAEIEVLSSKPFDNNNYTIAVNNIFNKYSTAQIVKMSTSRSVHKKERGKEDE